MRIKTLFYLLFLTTVFAVEVYGRAEIGQRAHIQLIDAKISFLARIDSGAAMTSLHAINIVFEDKRHFIYVKKAEKLVGIPLSSKIKNSEYKRDIGRLISFDTVNEKGEMRHIKTPIVDVRRVSNAQGEEYRYVVSVQLAFNDIIKEEKVNLRDRTQMKHKLLIGRNWLDEDFCIKTDMDVQEKIF